MAASAGPSRHQEGRGRSPPGHADVPLSDEDRMRLLISKCYDDGVLLEKFCHGEWVLEEGVRTFVVNTRLDELTTNWLKERTVTIIFQGEARDLPMRVREDLIRAYENGWYRQGIFDRSTKRGRVHAEGPNVVSYVARSKEITQWMVAKAQDVVSIRGVDYGMLFKPWLTRVELQERRRLDDETKFWVMAIRVPLRAMFHVESMVETAMGHVINSHPPEQDRTRPKLMNLKFELVKEAEDSFEPELLIRLGQEVLRIKFVCKHTPWCERCKWWFLTAEDGCPRVDEEQSGDSGGRQRNTGQPSDRSQRLEVNRFIRTAVRQAIPSNVGRGQPLRSDPAAEPIRAASSGTAVRRQGAQQLGGGPGSEQSVNRSHLQPLARTSRQSSSQDVRAPTMAARPPASSRSQGYQATASTQGHMHLANGFQPYIPRWGQTHWQGYGFQPFGVNPADLGLQFQTPYGMGQPLFYGPNFNDPSYGIPNRIGQPSLPGSGYGTGSRDSTERRRATRGSPEHQQAVSRPPPPKQQATQIDEDPEVSGEESEGHGGSARLSPTRSEVEVTRGMIPDEYVAHGRAVREREEHMLLPLVCTLQDATIQVVGLLNQEGNLSLPTVTLTELPMPSMIMDNVRFLFADRFPFKIFQEFYMPKIRVVMEDDSIIYYMVVFIDARFTSAQWEGLGLVGLGTFPLEALIEASDETLSQILVGPVKDRVMDVEVLNAPLSDHKPVVMKCSLAEVEERGPGYFRLNTSLLADEGIKDWVAGFWADWKAASSNFESTAEWIDAGLRVISLKLDCFSRISAFIRNKEESGLKQRVTEAEGRLGVNPISDLFWSEERARRLHDWEEHQVKQERWRAKVLEVKGIISSDRLSKDAFKRLLSRYTAVQMKELQHPYLLGKPIAADNKAMCNYAADYFQDILTTRRPFDSLDDNMALNSTVWNNVHCMLPLEGRLLIDRPVTAEELTETLKCMARGKAPGDDGLPVEFFAACWEVLVGDLVHLFNKIRQGGRLGRTMTRGIISLLFKKGDRSDIRNWRPISLLNVVYKLLAKLLSRRLGDYLPGLVQRDQGAFVRGRSIFENVVTAIEALELIEREELDVTVLLLDLEKAFDRVNWTFVLTTLRVMGFGECFCNWVKVMYGHATAAVCVNCMISEEFDLRRSLRQGCPLAPLLFVLHLEPLLCNIRCHPDIRGLDRLRGGDSRVKALADDLFVISVNQVDSLDALKGCLSEFARLSEAAVNWRKSTYFLPRRYAPAVQWGMSRAAAEEAERFLGVQIALGDCTALQEKILQEKVRKRILSWGPAFRLSLIGRVLAVMASAFALLWYVATIRRMSPPMLKAVKGYARRFIWKPGSDQDKGYICKVAWDTLCRPRSEGGLSLLDPASQNTALLARWVIKVAEAEDGTDWVLLAETLLSKEWGLMRPSDTWVAIMTETFASKRPKSKLWKEVLQAWKSCRPSLTRAPRSKDEVCSQHLFENTHIIGIDGDWFSLQRRPGNFGLSWLQKGLSKVGDLWDRQCNRWKSPAQLKDILGQLPDQVARFRLLLEAIPEDWKRLLGPEGTDPPGTWYTTTFDGAEQFCRLESWTEDNTRKCWLETYSRTHPNLHTLLRDGIRQQYGLAELREVRVRMIPPSEEGSPLIPVLVGNGTTLRCLRIDPEVWGWQVEDLVIMGLSNLNAALISKRKQQSISIARRVSTRWSQRINYLDSPSEPELFRLWSQLQELPSQKIASLLWLQSHLAVPTAQWLTERGVEVRNICDRCQEAPETMQHLWWDCQRSRKWWRWWEYHWQRFAGKSDLVGQRWVLTGSLPRNYRVSEGWGYIAQVGRGIMLWVIWLDRNSLRFQGKLMEEQAAEALFKKLLAAAIQADWSRKVQQGERVQGRRWFSHTWGLGLAHISPEGNLVLGNWLS
ncbi:hypothetical protein CBR_g34903 [Chara braunii]|uniref:Reverse transcriptase domain-containing protein n=1 Tax=Chara braunii TaxID=69332 RepID=A0A388LJT1_CHABU|nr:hypothetical protein CBR_g34903 [Chara braunii]|eukprot:GBG82527.1 hypothetical protein CBR_g34903 [Chara braunii]